MLVAASDLQNRNVHNSHSVPMINLIMETAVLQLYRPVHKASEFLATCVLPHNSIIKKIQAVVALILITPVALVSFVVGGTLDLLKNRAPLSFLKGAKEPTGTDTKTILSFNTCMLWGALPTFFGGVSPYQKRIGALAVLIKERNPDFICLQEMSRPAALKLWEQIKNDYHIGCYNIAPKPFIMLDSQLFIASKEEILKIQMIPLPTHGAINRAIVAIELGSKWIITTHFEAGDELVDQQMRQTQAEIVQKTVQQITNTEKPCFVMGDLNIKRLFSLDDEYSKNPLFHFLSNLDSAQSLSKDTATCTNELTAKARQKPILESQIELIDYALCSTQIEDAQLEKIETYNSEFPLSDHKALLLKV